MSKYNKRVVLRTMLATAYDVMEHGEPTPSGTAVAAQFESTCGACGYLFMVNDLIVPCEWIGGMKVYTHYRCPPRWETFAEIANGGALFMREAQMRSGSCPICGDVYGEGDRGHLLRSYASLPDSKLQWVCHRCKMNLTRT